jgi:hypothetical protein
MAQVNPFKIVITAVDKATSTVHKINRSFDRLTRPIRRLNQSIKALGRAAGFDRLGAALRGVIHTTRDLAAQLRSIAAPMLALIGGGTIAGLWGLARAWGQLGAQIGQTAATIGISITDLQALRGAAQAAGLSTQALDSGLKSLGDTLEDALYGRNSQALVTLNRLGIGIHKTASGAIDTKRALLDLSRVMARIKSPQVQGLVARTFGVESLLPLLRQGPKAIEAYQKRVAELGGVMSTDAIRAAEQFGLSLHYLGIATQGVRNAIGEKLLPVLQPLINRLTAWIGKNRELIATRVAQFVERLARWLERLDFDQIGESLSSFIQKVEDAVDWLGGWKNAALLVVVAMNGSLIASVINLGVALAGLGAALWANPILLAIGVIAGAIFLIYKNWDGLSRKIKDTLDGLGRWKTVAEVVLTYFTVKWVVGMLRAIGKVGKAFSQLKTPRVPTGAPPAEMPNKAHQSGARIGRALRWLINRPYLFKWGAGLSALLYSKSLNAGEEEEIKRIHEKERQWLQNQRAYRSPHIKTVAFRSGGQNPLGMSSFGVPQARHAPTAAIAQAMAFFKRKGWTHNQAAGIVANLKIESSLNPKAVGDHGQAYGIAQWHLDRQAEFKRVFGKDIRASTLTEQFEFQNYELTQGLEQKAGRLLRGARSAYEAARLFSDYCERPLNKQAEAMKRGQEAIRIAQMPRLPRGMLLAQEDGRTDRPRDIRRLNTAQPLFPSIVQRPAPREDQPESLAQNAQKMRIELTINGLPEGIAAQARTRDDDRIPVRIGYSMPSEVSV